MPRRQRGTCTFEGCVKPHFGKGFCNTHYIRFTRHGDPSKVGHYNTRKQRLVEVDGETHQVCSRCKLPKPFNEFTKCRSKTNGLAYSCKACNKPYFRKKTILKHGVTPEDYERLLAKQDGGCAICGTKSPDSRSTHPNFHVDHDHVTGKVRGLLCGRCNIGIGFFTDNPGLLEKAALYLKAHVEGSLDEVCRT